MRLLKGKSCFPFYIRRLRCALDELNGRACWFPDSIRTFRERSSSELPVISVRAFAPTLAAAGKLAERELLSLSLFRRAWQPLTTFPATQFRYRWFVETEILAQLFASRYSVERGGPISQSGLLAPPELLSAVSDLGIGLTSVVSLGSNQQPLAKEIVSKETSRW